MKILHTADWHLGLELHGISLLDAQRQMVRALAEAAQREGAEALLIGGDVFDRVQAPPEAIALYDEAMALFLNELRIPVYLIAGNHDAAPRLGSLRAVLQRLHLHVAGRLDPFAQPLLLEDCALYLLPHFGPDEARYFFPDAQIAGSARAMEVVLEQLKRSFPDDRRKLLLAHCFAAGGQAGGSDRSAQVGGSGRVPLETFEGFDYVALGHLHAPQTLRGFIRYAGSPLPYSFAEAGQAKSATLLDSQTLALRPIPLPCPYELVERSGRVEELVAFAEENRGSEAYCSLRLTDRAVDYAIERRLRELLPGLLLLQGQAPSLQADAVLRPEELSALSPLSLLRRYMQGVEGAPPDEEQEAWFLRALEAEGPPPSA